MAKSCALQLWPKRSQKVYHRGGVHFLVLFSLLSIYITVLHKASHRTGFPHTFCAQLQPSNCTFCWQISSTQHLQQSFVMCLSPITHPRCIKVITRSLPPLLSPHGVFKPNRRHSFVEQDWTMTASSCRCSPKYKAKECLKQRGALFLSINPLRPLLCWCWMKGNRGAEQA